MAELNLKRDIWISAPRERVWQAVTAPDQLAQWFLPPALGAQMALGDDGTLSVMMGPMGVVVAEVVSQVAPQRLTISPLPERQLHITYALEDEKGGTRVTVTMTGFEALPEAVVNERLGPSGAAWEKALQNLKAFVEGAELPYPEGYVAALFGYRRETVKQLAVERTIWINAPRERVWRAVTDPDQMTEWFSPGTPWTMTALEPGGRFYVRDAESGNELYTQIIDQVEPPTRFVTHSAPPELPHVSDWQLTEEQGGTRLTLTYSGYELEAENLRHANMEQNAFGFGMMLTNLRAVAEAQALPFPMGF